MASEHQVWIYHPNGLRVAVLDSTKITKLSYSRTVNTPGVMTLVVTRDAIADNLIFEDSRFEIWRKPEGGVFGLEGETGWFAQVHTRGLDGNRSRYRRIVAESSMSLLDRRVITANVGQAGALKTGFADNVMKAYVREATGAAAGNVSWDVAPIVMPRSWNTSPTLWFGVQGDLGFSTSITKDAGHRSLLATLQEIARDVAAITPTAPLYFDVVGTGIVVGTNSAYEFRTYAGVRGLDRTGLLNRLTVSPERGSLAGTVEVTDDYRKSASYIYAGGSGQRNARLVVGWGDQLRMVKSLFGLREGWIDASSAITTAEVQAEAQAELRRRRPTRTLTGELRSVPGAVYGKDWGFGDRLIAEFEHEAFSAIVESVTVTVEGHQETVQASLKGESL